MPELEELTPPQASVNPVHIQRNILEEHIELRWSEDFRRSVVCYSLAVVLILMCGVGGILLLYSTSSRSGEWRLAIGTILCILALLILMKQLLSSAVQDMNCIRNQEQIDLLKSGGFSDAVVLYISAIIIFTCGIVLIVMSISIPQVNSLRPLNTMYSVGVTLAAIGTFIFLGVLLYTITRWCIQFPRIFNRSNVGVFTISGRLSENQRRETTSSMANLI
uniref:Transmembrane protein 125 n=1 Tax=Geotrypetes seraphini TaxID=260995 RepID=A0A6P8NP10_GEOSA|nr:transmembrane protein 125 [Geotrypetes seraphini]XP_033772380.1 transmembrane protein 125 [Geotrypetes seraphini]XP_033772381.1 transmembrane protein 125 [Geotrypetes seraphini]XP_033772382.1 transmembrane protein 125 [Geotrypetes seraphini]